MLSLYNSTSCKMFLVLLVSLICISEVFTLKYNLLEQNYYDIDKIDIIFEQYIKKYGKRYEGDEYLHRKDIFMENLIKIDKWNEESPATFGDNEFTDLTQEEFIQFYLGPSRNASNISSNLNDNDEIKIIPSPDIENDITHLDWRDKGIITPVKSQLDCISGYAFSAVGVIEAQYALKQNTSVINLSEQQIIDCDRNDARCYGGLAVNAIYSVKRLGGLMHREDYPYEARPGDCMFDKSKSVGNVTGALFATNLPEDAIKSIVTNYGPIATSLLFTEKMRHIKTGKVYKPDDCKYHNKWDFNQEVLIVGFGRDNDDDYWIIKNSWGTHWGDRGYMRLIRGSEACNIGRLVSLALLK